MTTYPKHITVGLIRCKVQTLLGVFECWTKDRDCKSFVEAPKKVVFDRMDYAIRKELV